MTQTHFRFSFFCFLFFILMSSIHSQTEIPKVLPASPEASTLGQFGEIPVNMSLGTTGLSVPISNIKIGKFFFPLSLSYYNNGLIVDNIPGVLGYGWSLSSTGIVTRQVRGRPDEVVTGYIGDQMIGKNQVVKYHNGQLTQTQINQLNELSASNTWDTQPDKFMVSAPGLNATFYFDENKNPVIIPYKPYNIEVVNNDFEQGLKITNDSGVVYLFEAKEYSERLSPYFGIGDIQSSLPEYISGWKLTQILYPNNKSLALSYSDYNYTQEVVSESQTITLPNSVQGLDHKKRKYRIKSKLLNLIEFPDGQVAFINVSQTPNAPNQYLSRLSAIEIKNSSNTSVNKFDFTFDNNSKTRKLLEKIEINDDPENTYEFEYIGNLSDDMDYYKQDFWGYANSNNTNNLVNAINMYEPRKPDFNQSREGVLSKVVYPTGGSTEFNYEANTYDPGPDGDDLDDYVEASGECANLTKNLYAHSYLGNGDPFSESVIKTFTVTDEVYMRLYLRVIYNNRRSQEISAGLRRISGPGDDIGCESTTLPTCSECSVARENLGGGFNSSKLERKFLSSKQHKLMPGTYQLYAIIIDGFSEPCDTPNDTFDGCQYASATASISYSDENAPPDESVIIRSREVGGVRIKQVKSCPNDDPTQCVVKDYIYETTNGISQGHLFRRRNLFKSEFSTTTGGTGGQGVDTNSHESYGSSSNVPLGGYSGSHIIYKKVIERNLTNNSQDNGSIITSYKFANQPTPVMPFITKSSNERLNGKVLEKRILNNNGVVDKVLINQYIFSGNLNTNQRVLGFKAAVVLSVENGGNSYINDISIFSNNYKVDRLVRVRDFSWLNGSSIEIDKTIAYTNPEGNVKVEEIESSEGSNYKTEYVYPYEETTVINNLLVSNNRLSTPVGVSSYRDNTLLSSQKTIFRNWGSGIIEPELVQSSKNPNPLETRIIYHEYDAQGNPLDVSRVDGSNTTYIWGYNGQYLVAKIDNMEYNSIPLSLRNGIINASVSQMPQALQNLRNHSSVSNAMVTTFTFEPLIGMISQTDPRGYTMYYEYDAQNRLEFVKDADGNVLSKNEYNYKINN